MKISVETKAARDMFDDLAAKQMPYVMSKTINGIMLDAQAEVVRGIHERFQIKNRQFVKYSVKMRKFAKKNSLTAELGIADQRGSDILAKFEEGGTKTATDGRTLAIPVGVPRGARGVSPGNRPRTLIQAKKAFVIRTNEATGAGVILGRRGRGGKEVRTLFVLTPRVKIDNRLRFHDTVARTFELRFDRHFDLAFTEAMRTAR
jgi:hypothetical protein